MESYKDCSKEAVDLAEQSNMEGFPDHKAMATNRYVISGIQAILLILGLIVNVVICYVMVRRRRVKKNLSNFFLFNLSLTELILWLVVLPLVMIVSMTKTQSTIPCKVLAFSIFTCAGVIFGLLTAIAYDRYTNIISPLQAIVMEERKYTALALIWIVAIATSAPFLYSVTMRTVAMEFQSTSDNGVVTVKMTLHRGHGVKAVVGHATNVTHRVVAKLLLKKSVAIGDESNTSSLNTTRRNAKCILPMRLCDIPANLKGQLSCIVFFVLSFLAPLVFISFAYIKIVHRLWLRSRASDAQGQAAKATLRAVRMLMVVVLTFLLTDGPWTVGCLIYSFRPRGLKSLEHHFTALSVVTTLFYASAVLTPTIHALHSSTVQKEIVAVLCCRFRDKSYSTSAASLVSSNRKYSSIHYTKNNEKITKESVNNA